MKRRPSVMSAGLILSFFLFFLSACGGSGAEVTPEARHISFFAMDTFMEFTAYDNPEADLNPEDMDALMEEVKQAVMSVESKMSATNPDSDIYQANQNGGGEVKDETADLLKSALDLCKITGGALDISIYPIVRLWGFTTDEYQIPSNDEITELLRYVDYKNIKLDKNKRAVELGENMEIDLGAVAKGYAGKKAADMLRSRGVKSALLNLGGNIQTIGTKPDGSLWRIGVQDPDDASNYIGVFQTADKAAVTSGGYQRYFTGSDGVNYWHIMDPETGRPARKGLLSVTIVGRDGTVCDALSTALFIMGPDGAEAFWREHGESLDFDMILITDRGEIIFTPGLDFQMSDTADGYKAHILDGEL